MSRKKAEKTDKSDFVIGLLERHAHVPSPDDQLARYSKMYAGRAVGSDKHVQGPVAVEPEPVEQPTEVFFNPIEEEVAVLSASDDLNNDYDQPGATITMEAFDGPLPEVPAEPAMDAGDIESSAGDEEGATMTFDASDLDQLNAATVTFDAAEENGTMMMDAIDDGEQDGEPDGDQDAEPREGDNRDGDGGRAKKKKRRHR